jgi:hypothetical protein
MGRLIDKLEYPSILLQELLLEACAHQVLISF